MIGYTECIQLCISQGVLDSNTGVVKIMLPVKMRANMIITTIKIRNQQYEIIKADRFLDNGSCIQLVTQKGRLRGWNHEPIVLTKAMAKHILSFPMIEHKTKSRFWKGCRLFSITTKETI